MNIVAAFAKGSLGLDLWPGQVEVMESSFESHTRRWVWRLGRRSGKTTMAAVLVIWHAVMEDLSRYLRPGEIRYVLAIATRQEQSAEFARIVRELVAAAPDRAIRQIVDERSSTATEVVFRSRLILRCLPCSSRAPRGMAASLILLDELAWFLDSEAGYQAGREVYRTVSPSIRQFQEHGRIVVTSTPNWSTGIFADLVKAAERGEPDIYQVHRPTWTMNPTITREDLEGEFRSDPESASVEYAADFRSGEGAYLSAEDVWSAVREENVLTPQDGVTYVASLDVAYARDRTALAIGHRDQNRTVVDGVFTWFRAGHAGMLDEVAAVLHRYRVQRVRIDQYAEAPVREGLGARRIAADYRPWDNKAKGDAFGRLKAGINVGQLELPRDDGLITELLTLAATKTPAGLVRIAGAGSAHDDRAVAVAGLVEDLEGHQADVTVFDLFGGSTGGKDFTFVDDKIVWTDDEEREQRLYEAGWR